MFPIFGLEKNEFEEFSLKKANVATLAPESKPNVYSEHHCATIATPGVPRAAQALQ